MQGSGSDLSTGLNPARGLLPSTVAKTQHGDKAISVPTSLEGFNFNDMSVIPDLGPPSRFKWYFLGGVWALIPNSALVFVPDGAPIAVDDDTDGCIGEEVTDTRASGLL